MSPWAINRLSKTVEQGAVIAYSGDTIWGFGCHPLRPNSVDRILQIKRRSATKGLILLSSNLEFCLPYIDDNLSTEQLTLLQSHTHPTTWLVPANQRCPTWLRGKFPTVAIRITNHPFIQSFCNSIESPIVSTSANLTGKTPVRNSIQAHKLFANQLDFIVTGYQSGSGRPSQIKSLETGDTIRY